jgi:hypothetical protein
MRGRRVVPVLLALSLAGSCSEGSGSEGSGYLTCPDGPTEQVISVDGPPSGFDSYREAAVAVLDAPIPDETEFVVSGEHGNQVSVRVLGRTVLMMDLYGEPGNWSVGAYVHCLGA